MDRFHARFESRQDRGQFSRVIRFDRATQRNDASVVDRYAMRPGTSITGPALIEEREAMTVVLPDDVASISNNGHLVIEIAGGKR